MKVTINDDEYQALIHQAIQLQDVDETAKYRREAWDAACDAAPREGESDEVTLARAQMLFAWFYPSLSNLLKD